MHDNVSIHVNDANKEIQENLSSLDIDVVLLPSHSPDLNPVELVFNVMAQRFRARYHESMCYTDHDSLTFLHEVIDLITPYAI